MTDVNHLIEQATDECQDQFLEPGPMLDLVERATCMSLGLPEGQDQSENDLFWATYTHVLIKVLLRTADRLSGLDR